MTLHCADLYLDSLSVYKAMLNRGKLLLQTPVNIALYTHYMHSWPIDFVLPHTAGQEAGWCRQVAVC